MDNETKVRSNIYEWLINNFESKVPQNIVAINYGIQIIDNGYEVYFFGSDFYDENNEIWTLNNSYSPKSNFLFIENSGNEYSEDKIYKLYKSEILHFIKKNKSIYPKNIIHTTVTYFNGNPEVIFKQRNLLSDLKKGSFTMLSLIAIVTIITIIGSIISLLILWYTWE
jgi:hypothetical protein